MNQILITNLNNSTKNNKKVKKFKLIFFISIILLLVFITNFYITSHSKDNISNTLLNTFHLEHLYLRDNNEYTTIILNNNKSYFVIGSIEIPSINLNYPILSDVDDELLKIAPCRFYGPSPNEIGNLCIAAHNYDASRFFSNIFKLNEGDTINIYDSASKKYSYYVYNKYEVLESDVSCTSQNTNNKREITLVTCNNITGNRLIIKAKE